MLYRSLIFVPGNSTRFVGKAKTLKADIVCFDLEDSVPVNEKDTARKIIAEALKQRTQYNSNIYVRINSLESDLASRDLADVIQNGIDGIVLPKVNDESQIKNLDYQVSRLEDDQKMIKESIKLIPSIESAKGVVNAYSIARSSRRVNALVFGIFDFFYDMRLDYIENDNLDQYVYARAKVPVDARAAGVESIDGIWQNVDDIEGLTKDAMVAKRLGYSGKSIIHPAHIEPVHMVFVPTRSQIKWATMVVEALHEAMERGEGHGAVKLEGKMIDAVHYKQAKAILDSINYPKSKIDESSGSYTSRR
jgi:citrate lyase subunit beta/citryl-CoA lyase